MELRPIRTRREHADALKLWLPAEALIRDRRLRKAAA